MSVATEAAPPAPQGTSRTRRFVQRQAWTVGVIAILVILLIIEANVAPSFTSFDVQSLVIAALPLAFAAMGQSIVVISRGIDLSIGSVMALTNVIAASLMEGKTTLSSAILISALVLVIGLVIGTINGL